MEEFVWLNGTLCQKKDANLSIEDRGLLIGDGVFETMRSYSGKVFRLGRHLSRLFDALTVIHLPIAYEPDQLKEVIYDTLKANQLQEASIRLTITRGQAGRGIDPPENPSPSVIVTAQEFIPYPERFYREGMKIMISEIRQNLSSPVSRIKSLNFLNNILARIEVREKGCDEAILLNTDGFVCEGTVSNIFLVKNGNVITPDRESWILPGITRETIIELALRGGMRIEERKVNPSELIEVAECFFTNTLMEVMPVSEIEEKKIGQGRPGPLTLHFMERYKDLVRKELRIES